MIPRYDKKEISSIWTDQFKFETYLKVELAVLKAMEGVKVPEGIAAKIAEKAVINPDRINEIEAVTRHDVIAFCSSVTENMEPEIGKYFHFGVTSSDIIDSALTLQLKKSLEVVLPVFRKLLHSLHTRADEMKDVIAMGRSHGMFAEPLSFGQKILGHYNEFSRRYKDLVEFYENELTIQLSGAVGNYTIISPEIESKVGENLGVNIEPLSTQVIPRDRIAKLINVMALTGAAIERLSVEIRHLQRTEVGEAHEGFAPGQKGSSIMPHKKNPISGENLTGMARMLQSYANVATSNVVLWHERDISHSSAERFMLPDAFGVFYYSLDRLSSTVDHWVFDKERIEARVYEETSYLSSYYLHHLILNTDLKRDELYPLVQEAAFAGQQSNSRETFFNTLKKIVEEKGLKVDLPFPNQEEIKKIYLNSVGHMFKRSLDLYPLPQN